MNQEKDQTGSNQFSSLLIIKLCFQSVLYSDQSSKTNENRRIDNFEIFKNLQQKDTFINSLMHFYIKCHLKMSESITIIRGKVQLAPKRDILGLEVKLI